MSLVEKMRPLGFKISGNGPDFVQFTKEYADASGRIARAHVFFNRPMTSLGATEYTLANIVVSVQASIEPTLDAVLTQAPEVTRDDLSRVCTAFETPSSPPMQHVVTRECISCHQIAHEFYVVNDDAICWSCVEQHRALTAANGIVTR